MKTRTWILISALVLLIAAGVFLIWYYNKPLADAAGCMTVSVYSDPDFDTSDDASACLAIGSYDSAWLTTNKLFGEGNDPISSIKVPTGYTATIFAEDNFKGAAQLLDKDYPRLDIKIPGQNIIGWADNIKSIKVAAAITSCNTVTVYSDPEYDTTNDVLDTRACLPVGKYTKDQLSTAGMSDDLISSLKISSGYQAVIFFADEFKGKSQRLIADVPKLADIPIPSTTTNENWDDNARSIRIEAITACPSVKVFSDPGFDENDNVYDTTACLAAGDYNSAKITEAGIGDDPISSIKVPTGYTATIFALDEFAGASQKLTADVSSLSDLTIPGQSGNWGDNVKSIRVESTTTVSPSVTLLANDKADALTVKVNENFILKWTIKGDNMSASKYCTATPPNTWFMENAALTGSDTMKISAPGVTTFKLSCWPSTGSAATAVSDQVVVTAVTSTSSTPTVSTSASATATATATVTATRSTVTLANPTLTTSSGTGATAGTGSANTGPETPLVAGGALTLIFASYFVVKKYLG